MNSPPSNRSRFPEAATQIASNAPALPASITPPEASFTAASLASPILSFAAYQRDLAERSILFWDVLRKRANNMLEHEDAGLPPLLSFKYELLLDGRQLERRANYALLRITEAGDACWDDCVDPEKPPVIVLDPRAGHGPGLGGFKRDSEVGIALHTGHPVYFVVFFPEPCPHQKIADVLDVLKIFIAHVIERHGGRKPILYGNCQAGWAVTLLSAAAPGLPGPAVLNGSPLSYWSGEPGINPMRIMAGFNGGVWLAHFLSDLNRGRFDGAWLVQNFETLRPGNAVWDKYVKLFIEIDTEEERFLDFERWWNGFYRLSTEEIVAIIGDLFVGNRLEQSNMRLDDSVVDLKRITNPLIIFASYGDNITPPHQALGWIPTVYGSTEALKRAGQRIIYLTNPHVGHLGIFVSASVARLEHRAILEHIDRIEALPPGLYEMKIENPTHDPDCRKDQYRVHFEPRSVEFLHFDYPEQVFSRVRDLSEFFEEVYRGVFSPWVKAAATPWLASWLHWMHPMRFKIYMWSEQFLPWMHAISAMAEAIRCNRAQLPAEVTFKALERRMDEEVSAYWETARKVRDATQERAFKELYDN